MAEVKINVVRKDGALAKITKERILANGLEVVVFNDRVELHIHDGNGKRHVLIIYGYFNEYYKRVEQVGFPHFWELHPHNKVKALATPAAISLLESVIERIWEMVDRRELPKPAELSEVGKIEIQVKEVSE